jgi:diadenosine tetraphosphate (Ap4A) HIT family hydrolase
VVNKPEQDREIENTLLEQTDHFQWLPGLGAFVEGYSLIVSRKHVLNTGCFDVQTIDELELLIRQVRETLRRLYKKESIVFEHGSMGNRDYAGSCIEHHHIHILPADIPRVPIVLSNSFEEPQIVHSMKPLIRFNQERVAYIYYEPRPKQGNVFKVDVLPRQYLRQVIAKECGCPQNWDWREKPFKENIRAFLASMKKLRREE